MEPITPRGVPSARTHAHTLIIGGTGMLRAASIAMPSAMPEVEARFPHRGAYARCKHVPDRQGGLQRRHDCVNPARRNALGAGCRHNAGELDARE